MPDTPGLIGIEIPNHYRAFTLDFDKADERDDSTLTIQGMTFELKKIAGIASDNDCVVDGYLKITDGDTQADKESSCCIEYVDGSHPTAVSDPNRKVYFEKLIAGDYVLVETKGIKDGKYAPSMEKWLVSLRDDVYSAVESTGHVYLTNLTKLATVPDSDPEIIKYPQELDTSYPGVKLTNNQILPDAGEGGGWTAGKVTLSNADKFNTVNLGNLVTSRILKRSLNST